MWQPHGHHMNKHTTYKYPFPVMLATRRFHIVNVYSSNQAKKLQSAQATNPKFWVWKIKYLHWFWNCIVEFIVICSALLMIKIFGMIMNFIFFSSLVTRHVAEAVDTRSSRIYSSAAAAKEDSAVVEERPTHLSCSRNTRWTKKKIGEILFGVDDAWKRNSRRVLCDGDGDILHSY